VLTWINRGPPNARIMTIGNFAEQNIVKRLLAFVAVLFLLVRPVCDAWAGAHGHGGHVSAAQSAAHADHLGANQHADFCCAKLQDGQLFLAGSVGLTSAPSDGSLFAVTHRSRIGRESLDRHDATRLSAAPLTRFSYYARSARILR